MEKIKVHFYNARAGKLADKVVGIASVFSHVELEIDGVCYSSSNRDRGVRSKVIDTLPVNVYYKCQGNHYSANNVVTITISSQSITFEDNQRGIDKEAFFTLLYFKD